MGSKIIAEFSEPPESWAANHILEVMIKFGVTGGWTNGKLKEQKYAKILPIDNRERKRFIAWATDTHNIYSLGRFATWRPGLLLDDLVHDVRVIQRIVEHGPYDHRKGE